MSPAHVLRHLVDADRQQHAARGPIRTGRRLDSMGTVVGPTLMRARGNKGMEREDLAREMCVVFEQPEKAVALAQALRRVEHAPDGVAGLPDDPSRYAHRYG